MKKLLFMLMAAFLISACGKTEKILIPGQQFVPEEYQFFFVVKTVGNKQFWGVEGAVKKYPKPPKDETKEADPPYPDKVRIAPKWEAVKVLGNMGGFAVLKDGLWRAFSLDGEPIEDLPYFSEFENFIPIGSPHSDAQVKMKTEDGIFMAFQFERPKYQRGLFPTFSCFGPYDDAEFGYHGYFFYEIDDFDERGLWGYKVFNETDPYDITTTIGPGCYSILEVANVHTYMRDYYFLVESGTGWEVIGRRQTVPISSFHQGQLFLTNLPLNWSQETLLEWLNQLPDGEFHDLLLPGNKKSFKGFWNAKKKIGVLANDKKY